MQHASGVEQITERRARLVRRHLLDGSGSSALQGAQAVVALHATDPASVYLSTLARSHRLTLEDVGRELYEEHRLLRLMAMRRTLFVVPRDLAPVVHHAASLDVAATMRRRLLQQLRTLPTDPELPDDLDSWLADTQSEVDATLRRLQVASGAQLGKAVPQLSTALLPTTDKAYDVRRTVTSQVLALSGAEGRIVRGTPLGSWTSRQHTWEPATVVWPDGVPQLDREDARTRLVEEYLRSFGPATEADVAWWTGWPLGVTRKVIAAVDTVAVEGGLVLSDDTDPDGVPEPTAALLPALDPTPMGWKGRDWFLPEDRTPLYDRMGNIGPTVWWAGEVIGAWATRAGRVVTEMLTDRGRAATDAVQAAADQLTDRLGGADVVPSFPTPLARELAGR